ncbi:MAG: hypothetical protein LWW94_08555 [Candidatus Desulfofervidaceae bacterium]|nr:hypothetical protein [Candidatus Desulfofervidaceae bacterium]
MNCKEGKKRCAFRIKDPLSRVIWESIPRNLKGLLMEEILIREYLSGRLSRVLSAESIARIYQAYQKFGVARKNFLLTHSDMGNVSESVVYTNSQVGNAASSVNTTAGDTDSNKRKAKQTSEKAEKAGKKRYQWIDDLYAEIEGRLKPKK